MMEYTQEQMVKSLGFYVNFKKNKGAPEESCFGSYLVVLSSIEPIAKEIAPYAGFTPANPLVPLAKINVPPAWYKRIVELIFEDGISFSDLTVAKVKGNDHPSKPPAKVLPKEEPPKESYFGNYLALPQIKGDVRTENDVTAILNRMNDLLQVPENQNRVNGLVVGRVQSGKTRNYVGLMLKALDEGWNVFIVLTSANLPLAEQTQSRIEKDFEDSKAFGQMLDFHGNGVHLPSLGALQQSNCSTFFWGVAMKQKNNLQRLLEWFNKNKGYSKNVRVLVIDDESDNATPDSGDGKSKFLSDDDIVDLAANIRDEEEIGEHAEDLADWVEGLTGKMSEKFEEMEKSPTGAAAEAIANIKNLLEAKDVKDSIKRNKILNTEDKDGYLTLLGLKDHASVSGGEAVDLTSVASDYFNKAKGNGNRSHGKFLRFLKTVFDIAEERSAISAQVCAFVDRTSHASGDYTFAFGKCAYIAYTATPYANILNETVDETPLYADFMFSLECSPRYFGLKQIFGSDFESVSPRMPIVDAISHDEVRYVLKPLQGIKDTEVSPPQKYSVEIGPSLLYQTKSPLGEVESTGNWTSLKEAIAWAFCSAGARAHARKTKFGGDDRRELRWTTMLMNISQKRDVHEEQTKIVGEFLKAQCETVDGQMEFLGFCKSVWEAKVATFAKKLFDHLFNNDETDQNDRYGAIDDYPVWADIEDEVRNFVDPKKARVHVIAINSTDCDLQDKYNQVGTHVGDVGGDNLWILCGGNTISRGLTLAGLTTSYFDRVRNTVSVDTLTQMGRWFGYRPGYELLPRIWMSEEAIIELKKTAVVEEYLHESIREKFEAGISPNQDPENYAKIYFWGRRLSGRTRAQRMVVQGIGTSGGTSGDLSADSVHIASVATKMRDFLQSLGEQAHRSDEYRYRQFPLWENVDKEKVREYVLAQAKDSPERTKRVLNALAHEIERTGSEHPSDLLWDVVVGEPLSNKNKAYDIGVGRMIWSVKPPSAKVKANRAYYSSVRSDPAFYAMIRKADLVRTEAEILLERIDDVAATVEAESNANGGILPRDWADALAGFTDVKISDRVRAFLKEACEDPLSASLTDEGELPPCFRKKCLPHGYHNRSSTEYRERVYEMAGYRRPILQIYLLTPPDGSAATEDPMVIHAFYWPKHTPDEFDVVSVGLPAPEKKGPPLGKFGKTVADVLEENGFPMRSGGKVSEGGGLREKVVSLLAADGCDEAFYNANIAKNLWGAPYKAMPAPHSDCYYHVGWAEDPIAKIRGLILQWALEVLADHQVHEERLLAQAVVAAHPLLIGVYPIVQGQDVVMVTDDWREIFTDEVLAENGIEKVSGNPISYRLKFEKEEAGWW